MFVNHTPPAPAGEPDPQELAELEATFLPPVLVMLVPEADLQRRCHEINLEHPRFREETPVVLRREYARRRRLSAGLHVAGREAAESYGSTAQMA